MTVVVEGPHTVVPDLTDDVKRRPIPAVLYCGSCKARHLDEGEWATRPHRTHQCQSCGHEWTPFSFYTVGVQHTPRFSPSEVILMRRMGITAEQFWAAAEALPRAVLVGEAPGSSSWDDCPLFPFPARSAGGRLMEMSGMSSTDYLTAFQRVNLLGEYPGTTWHGAMRKKARTAANLLANAAEAKAWPVVLFGVNVATAFAARDLPLYTWHRLVRFRPPGVSDDAPEVSLWRPEDRGHDTGLRVVRLPHPSGRNRDLNDPRNQMRVRAILQEALS